LALTRLNQPLSFYSRTLATAREYQRRYGGDRAFDDLGDALTHPGIESCVICVPHHLHEEYVAAAVQARKHILLEKPLAHSLASAARIADLVATAGHGRAFMLAEQMHYLPVLSHLRRLPQSSAVRYVFTDRSPYQPTGWRTQLDCAGGGVMLDLGIHYVSLAVRAFGPIASHEKTVLGRLPHTDIPCAERLHLQHANGVEGDIDVAWASPETLTRLVVEGASGTFQYQLGERIAWFGRMPRFVCLRSANGRMQMMTDYIAKCRMASPPREAADALPVLAAVF